MPDHREQRLIRHAPGQVFDIVADIERYPEFLPWCIGARVRAPDGQAAVGSFEADLIIGFKMFRESYTSRVMLDRPGMRINVEYVRGPLKHLHNRWRFEDHAEGCLVDFDVGFEFRSSLLNRAMGPMFHEAVRRMGKAFEARAAALHG